MSNIIFGYTFDFSAIVLLLTVQLLLVFQRQIYNPIQRPYLLYISISIITASLNMTSIYFLENPKYSIELSYSVCILFYVAFQLQILSVYLYFNKTLNMKRNLRIFYLSIPAITVLIMLISNSKTGLIFSVEADKSFTYGPLYILLWVSGICYLIDSTIFFLKKRKQMQERKVKLSVFSLFFLLSTVTIHYMFPSIQILQFTNSLLILIVFVESQNPILSEDAQTGALNADTFDNYILNLINSSTSILFVYIKNTNISSELSTFSFINNTYSNIINKTRKAIRSSTLFRIEQNTFAITYRDEDTKTIAANIWKDEIEALKQSNPAALPLRYVFAHTAPLNMFTDRASFKKALQWGLQKLKDSNNKTDLYITSNDAISFVRHRIIDTEIHKIVNNKPIDFNLQPIYNLNTNTFDTAEALARIEIPSIGFVPNGEFISISENNGTIISIGKSMIKEICNIINTIKMPFETISINVSMIHFMEPTIVEDFLSILKKHNVDSSQIILEITESTKVINWNLLKTNMFKLKDVGFKLSLDDFGTGYSTFESFLTLPFDIIKIDRNLLLACENDSSNKKVLKTLVKMIKSLNFETILEGVETKEQDKIARDLGVDKVQGFYYSKPLSAAGLISFANKFNV